MNVIEGCWGLRIECKLGIVLFVWGGNFFIGVIVGWVFVYLFVLLFLFLGVLIIFDCFMLVIEIIILKEKEIRVIDK